MNYRILLVNHETAGLKPVQQLLVEAGYDVAIADDAVDALEAFEYSSPDLALVAESGPSGCGSGLCKMLKDDPRSSGTSLVLMTDAGQPASLLHAESGADAILDGATPGDQILNAFRQLLPSVDPVVPIESAHDSTGEVPPVSRATDELLDALEQLDSVMEDPLPLSEDEAGTAPVPEEELSDALDRLCDDAPALDSGLQDSLHELERIDDWSPAGDPEDPELEDAITGLGPNLPETFDDPFESSPSPMEEAGPAPPEPAAEPAAEPTSPAAQAVDSPSPDSSTDFNFGDLFDDGDLDEAMEAGPEPLPAAATEPVAPNLSAVPATDVPAPAPPANIGVETISLQRADAPAVANRTAPAQIAPGPAAVAPPPRKAPPAVAEPKQVASRPRTPIAPLPGSRRLGMLWPIVITMILLAGGAATLMILDIYSNRTLPVSSTPMREIPRPTGELAAPPAEAPFHMTGDPVPAEDTADAQLEPRVESEPVATEPDYGAERFEATPAVKEPTIEPAVIAGSLQTPDPAPADTEPADTRTDAPVETSANTGVERTAAVAVPGLSLFPGRVEVDPAVPAVSAEVVPMKPAEVDAASPEPVRDDGTGQTAPPTETFAPPRVQERVTPAYPSRARNRRQGAEIVLRVLVDETGGVSRIQVEQGSRHSDLEAAAIDAVLRWKYEPATEDGTPVRAWTIERIVFQP